MIETSPQHGRPSLPREESGAGLPRAVLAVVRHAGWVGGQALVRALPDASEREIAATARQLVAQGRLWEHTAGKDTVYFASAPLPAVEACAGRLLTRGVFTATALRAAVERELPGHGGLVPEWLTSALSRGLAFEQASIGAKRLKRYGARPDLQVLFRRTLAALAKDWAEARALGVGVDEVLRVLAGTVGATSSAGLVGGLASGRGPDSSPGSGGWPWSDPSRNRSASPGRVPAEEAALWQALSALAERRPPGALLSVRELRAGCGLDKTAFDRAALALAEDGRVVLHHHDLPGALSAAEREELIADGRGNHYVGIALPEVEPWQ